MTPPETRIAGTSSVNSAMFRDEPIHAKASAAMLNFSHQTRVFLCTTPVDMRKSFRGLCLLAESLLEEDPASGHWFVFLNRRADRLKLLGWDGRGLLYRSGAPVQPVTRAPASLAIISGAHVSHSQR